MKEVVEVMEEGRACLLKEIEPLQAQTNNATI
jgi:hypothetical protein